MQLNITLPGAQAIIDHLTGLGGRVAKKVVGQALRAGAKVVHEAAVASVPRRSGTFAGSLRVRSMRRRGGVGMRVRTQEGWYRGDAFYGAFVEFGHKVGRRPTTGSADARRVIPGRHDIEKAAERVAPAATDAIADTLAAGIERESA